MIVLNFILYYFIIIPISLLPFRLLYILSDIIFILIYHVFGYRKKVVLDNLRKCFPEKPEKEIKAISKNFYRHFCDLVVESIKIFTISKEALLKRVRTEGSEILIEYYNKNQSVIGVTGHYCNWEWIAVTLNAQSPLQGSGIYAPLKNKFFNKKMMDTRSRWGTELMAPRDVAEFIEATKDKKYIYGFIADQNPSNPLKAIWTEFLGRDTAFMNGSERYSKLFNLPLVFGEIRKPKRGHYVFTYKKLCEQPLQTSDGEITAMHAKMLESLIREKPEYWLWSHRRWKHQRPSNV